MKEIEKAILKTLAYADIFNFPLTSGEIWGYLIARDDNREYKRIKNEFKRISEFEDCLKVLISGGKISADEGYCFLKGREKIVGLRKKREKWSREKVKKAKRIANLLKIIPTVKLVGISGALAMNNAEEGDDIDLFIITSSGRLWLTRFLVTLLVEVTGQRRKPRQGKLGNWRGFPYNREAISSFAYKDKVCLNMFVDEVHLAVPPSERNLFTAHEVVQMKPLWSRDGVYQRFLRENLWVGKFLPNSLRNTRHETRDTILPLYPFLSGLERLLMVLQLKYMQKRRTTEKISPGRILFHPEDKGKWVLENLKLKMKKLKLDYSNSL